MGACPPVVAGNFSKYNQTLNSTRFVRIYVFVQSNIQHVSPASAWGLRLQTPTGALPLDPAGRLP